MSRRDKIFIGTKLTEEQCPVGTTYLYGQHIYRNKNIGGIMSRRDNIFIGTILSDTI